MKKIALLFLTIDNLKQEELWNLFLENSKDYFNIYVHPKHPKKITQKILKPHIIKNITKTKWGGLSYAMTNLIEAALKNKENVLFYFITDSCIPLYSPKKIYDNLIKIKNTTVSRMKIETWRESEIKSIFKKDLLLRKYNINSNKLIKHETWILLNYSDAKYIVKKRPFMERLYNYVALEEYICNILYFNNRKIDNRKITYTNWKDGVKIKNDITLVKNLLWKLIDDKNLDKEKNTLKGMIDILRELRNFYGAHPKVYKNIKLKDLEKIKTYDSLFMRKVDKDTNTSLIYDKIKKNINTK